MLMLAALGGFETESGDPDTVVDGADAFFTTVSAVYRVPAAGGEPVNMQVDHRGTLFVVDRRVFLVSLRHPTGQIVELRRTGTEVSALPIAILPEPGQDLISPLWMDATHLYYQPQSSDFSNPSYRFYRIAWNGGASEKLADLSGRGIGEAIQIGRAFLKGGETLAPASIRRRLPEGRMRAVNSKPSRGRGTETPSTSGWMAT